jgi:hypothetical protein
MVPEIGPEDRAGAGLRYPCRREGGRADEGGGLENRPAVATDDDSQRPVLVSGLGTHSGSLCRTPPDGLNGGNLAAG